MARRELRGTRLTCAVIHTTAAPAALRCSLKPQQIGLTGTVPIILSFSMLLSSGLIPADQRLNYHEALLTRIAEASRASSTSTASLPSNGQLPRPTGSTTHDETLISSTFNKPTVPFSPDSSYSLTSTHILIERHSTTSVEISPFRSSSSRNSLFLISPSSGAKSTAR